MGDPQAKGHTSSHSVRFRQGVTSSHKFFAGANPDKDIVIVIMGATGAGKSTFTNFLLGPERRNEYCKVGTSIRSCTVHLQPILLELPPEDKTRLGYDRIVAVDTPGFDDTFTSDVDILKRIADWLTTSYCEGMLAAGVIYVHDITQERYTGTARRNYKMFEELCGERFRKKSVVVTSKWERIREGDIPLAEGRENELKNEFWGDISVKSFRPADQPTAWGVISHLMKNVDPKPPNQKSTRNQKSGSLSIQEEMVVQHRTLPQTSAGQALRYTLQEIRDITRHRAVDDEEEARNLDNIKKSLKELRTPLLVRMKQFFGVYRNRP